MLTSAVRPFAQVRAAGTFLDASKMCIRDRYKYLAKRLRGSYSCEQICQTLRSMEVRELLGEGYIPNYTRTDLTDDLHESFGFRTDYDFIPKDTMKKIITSSQKRKKQEK